MKVFAKTQRNGWILAFTLAILTVICAYFFLRNSNLQNLELPPARRAIACALIAAMGLVILFVQSIRRKKADRENENEFKVVLSGDRLDRALSASCMNRDLSEDKKARDAKIAEREGVEDRIRQSIERTNATKEFLTRDQADSQREERRNAIAKEEEADVYYERRRKKAKRSIKVLVPA